MRPSTRYACLITILRIAKRACAFAKIENCLNPIGNDTANPKEPTTSGIKPTTQKGFSTL